MVCGYTLSPNTTADAFRAKVNLHLHNLLEPNSDDHSGSLSPEIENILTEEGPDLIDFVSCCIKIRFGHETGRETELMEFARIVGNCLSLSLTERSTTAQLSSLKLFRGDKAHAQHVLGDCSTLGADGARLKLDYAALCSCLGTSSSCRIFGATCLRMKWKKLPSSCRGDLPLHPHYCYYSKMLRFRKRFSIL